MKVLLKATCLDGSKSVLSPACRHMLDYVDYLMCLLLCKDHKGRECVKILDLRVQVHPGELWVSKQRVHIVLEASKSAGAKGGVPKICEFVHPLQPC